MDTKIKLTDRRLWNSFPNCNICNAMKQDRWQNVEDLKKFFAEAEKKSGAVIKF